MMLPGVFNDLPRRVHGRVPALLDRLEIWDAPVTLRSRFPASSHLMNVAAPQSQSVMRSAVTLLLINQRRAAVRSAVVGGRERGSRLRETQQPLTRCGDSRLR
jgi:hypothetical protein